MSRNRVFVLNETAERAEPGESKGVDCFFCSIMSNRELSNLKIDRKECARCGAVWLNGVHRWHTGNKGSELDLASLVCNSAKDPRCPNPKKGQSGGDTWAKRRAFIDAVSSELGVGGLSSES